MNTPASHLHYTDDHDAIRTLERSLINATNLCGLWYPEERGPAGYALIAAEPEIMALPLAERLPPNPLRHYYGFKNGRYDDDAYLRGGMSDIRTLRRILAEDGFTLQGERILEFGCAAGRMMRHLQAEAEANEVWGCDVHAGAIHWAQNHLSPPFHFFLNTTAPHLPFEDRSFGLIFAGSVWTHIGELDDAWLLELRRILRPGGRLYLTISDQDSLMEIERVQPLHPSIEHVDALDAQCEMLTQKWQKFITRSTPWQQRVVYNREAWLSKIGRWLDVKQIKLNGYGWQTVILLAKPEV